jgi:predicted unusual protein kinase regulating ubiquinone biosynthesis (AarF/ABC1/UbiB family)
MAIRSLPRGLLSRTAATGRVVGRLGLSGARRLVRRSLEEDAALGEALFSELDQMKGMAMKVGQILSYMDVGLPPETERRLARLQEGAEPFAFEAIRPLVEAALGAPLEALFERFDPEPVAAASVGQVHRARFDGREVAVKVRYPGVEETVAEDFARLERLGRVASLATAVDGGALVAELRERMVAECDYAMEAANQRLFGRLLAGEPLLRVPAVVDARCGDGVLTTAWHEGTGFQALLEEPHEERAAAAVTLARFPFLTLFGHGLLQADPHPGNFRFRGGGAVTALDYGCVRRFTREQVEDYRHLSRVVVCDRRADFPDAAARAGLAPAPERLDMDEMWAMMCWMYAPYRAPRFRFERGWWERIRELSRPTNPNLRHQGMPPHWVWLQPTQVGLHAVLLKLEVEAALREPFLSLLDRPLDATPPA